MKPKRTGRLVVVSIVALYAVTMLFGGCASKFILHPTTMPVQAYTAQPVMVDVGRGRTVECWVDRSPSAMAAAPVAYAIEFTGNASRAEYIASHSAFRWNDRPVESWAVNYPGYGRSTGPADLQSIAPAALAVYDEVARRAQGRPIFVGGNSLGTTAAIYVATQRRVEGLILQNPPALRNLILTQYGWWNLWLLAGPIAYQVPSELDSPHNAALIKAPAIFTLAGDDQMVVPANQQKVVDAYAGPKRLIHISGGHNGGLSGNAVQQFQAELDWLWNQARLPTLSEIRAANGRPAE